MAGLTLLQVAGCAAAGALQSVPVSGPLPGDSADWGNWEAGYRAPQFAKHLSSASLSPSGDGSEKWPIAYTVELDAKGRLRADGQAVVDVQELSRLSSAAARQNTFAAAVLFAAPEVPQQVRAKVTQTLIGSGFAQVRVAGRTAPKSLRRTASAPSPRAVALPPVAAPASPKPARQTMGLDSRASVTVQTVGLHVGGGASSEEARQQLVRHFEQYFGELISCHRLARDRQGNALFGVDLYVPGAGGRAKVGQVRSRLRGREFRQCMTRLFSAIEFPAPASGQNSAVSYSVLFKPQARPQR